ncbi:UDP-galactopyranose mutase [Qipengyuania sediminis]|uniref:UDP-galactopyranose mutase n=1 Tax=Qipengyuania sediminis TaxID=1532023 RepID=UPI00105A07F3|nr:UDP-galactopyranose mutase [Qipengyuania sediminis]
MYRPDFSGTQTGGIEARNKPVLICFSHLRWDFVFQRPQHILSRLSDHYRVMFWQEPQHGDAPGLSRSKTPEFDVEVLTPTIIPGRGDDDMQLRTLLDALLHETGTPAVRWYYTPMMLSFSEHVAADCTIYDCMDELANFRFAPPELLEREERLLAAADLVFTGGFSLFDAKRERHPRVYPFPSSVDKAHFAKARALSEPHARPRFGFFGVIDERMDIELLDAVAAARPDWDFEIVGPVVKIDPASLPQHANLSFPGGCGYADLPATLARWDVALMPFAINEATRFISPTKTPEYLAAGRPVVSTPVRDVVRSYGRIAAVKIAEDAQGFIAACEAALVLAQGPDRSWLAESDALLADESWDKTVAAMRGKIAEVAKPERRAIEARAPIDTRGYDWLVVGAGFAGSVMAERLASDAGKRVLVIDRRDHIAGNAYDRPDAAGILIHQYGPHIFHTNSQDVFDYLSGFTDWRPYEHRVLAEVDGKRVPIPINRTTLNALYGLSLSSDEEAERYYADAAETLAEIKTSEDVVVAQVGRDLYEKFFRGYTRKQWGLDPSELDKSVTARVPARTDTDDRYFTDTFQAMPEAGYTAMFERMLDHPNITVRTGTEFADVGRDGFEGVVYTGPIDEFYGHRFGMLPYRSLRFDHRTLDREQFQETGTVNYPGEDVPWTRITEYKHLTGQQSDRTSITYEYSAATGDPFYPVPRAENQAIYKRYQALALAEEGVLFVGRLATYRYYNMDQVVGQALATYRRLKPTLAGGTVGPSGGADAEPAMAK